MNGMHPGGHMMRVKKQISFWREVQREFGIEVEEVQFLDHTETTWEGVTKKLLLLW